MSDSRLEKFIYAICSMEVSDLPAPLSRIETLWNCLITGETPDFEPQSRNEQYLMAMLGLYDLENLPAPMSRGEKLLYKIAMGETDLSDIPVYLSRYEELLGYLAENGGVGDFEYILQTLNQRLSTLYSTKERPMKQAVIKGDTLVNELPRPSLKNTMVNVESQKLNQGYDNGKTLINIHPVNYTISMATGTTFFADSEIVRDSVQPNTKYIVRLYNTHESITQIYFKPGVTQKLSVLSTNNKCAIFTTKETLSDSDFLNNKIHFYSNVAITLDDVKNTKILVCKYQDGMENWDIPYFEGTKTFSATPNVVEGEFKQAVVKGQTLVNLFKETIRDTAVDTNYRFFKIMGNQLQPLKGNSQYTLIFDKYVEGISTVVYKTHANSLSTESYQAGQKILFTTVEDVGTEFHIFVRGTTIDIAQQMLNLHPKVIILEGDYTNVDIPYFEGMQSVQLSEVTTTGKNLFDINKKVEGYIATNSTREELNGMGNTWTTPWIKAEPNTDYVISGGNRNRWQQKSSSGVITYKDNPTITTASDTEYIRCYYCNETYTATNVQLEKGSVATPYEPYQSNTLTLAEPVTLRKVGDVEDEFDALTGQVTERVGEFVLDGKKQLIGKYDTVGNTVGFYYDIKMIKPKDTSTEELASTCICDKVKVVDLFYQWCNDWKDEEFISIASDGRVAIRLLSTKASTIDEANRYLAENPITLYYQLGTESTKTINPTITDQDGATQTKLHSFNDGHISVSSQGLLPSAVNYEVPTNNSYYLPDMLTLGAQYTTRGSADCHATIDGKLLSLGKNRTFTTPSSVTNRLMVLDAPVDDLMFIKGDQTAKDFGYFEGMKSVGLSNKMPDLKTTGKNLFNGYNEFIKVNHSEKLYLSSSDTTGATRILLTAYDENKNLITSQSAISSNNAFYHRAVDNKWMLSSNKSQLNTQLTLSDDVKYVVFETLNGLYMEYENIQLEESSVATSYEPFKSNILTVNEEVELGSVCDVQDELNVVTGEVVKATTKIKLDSTLGWVVSNDYGNGKIAFISSNEIYGKNQINGIVSDRFPTNGDSDSISLSGVSGRVIITALTSKISNWNDSDTNGEKVRKFGIYLDSLNAYARYINSEKVVKTVDLTTVDQDGQPTKLKTFNDITHVEIKADNVIPSVDMEVATKISETLSTLGLEHHDISETQNKLGQTINEQTENTDATMMATTEIYEQTL